MPSSPLSLRLSGACACLWLGTAGAAAQDGAARRPGSLDMSYESVIGTGDPQLQVVEPRDAELRPADPPPLPADPANGWLLRATPYFEQALDANIDGPGDLGTRRGGLRLDAAPQDADGAGGFGFGLDLEAAAYDFDGSEGLFPGAVEPVQDLFSADLRGQWSSDPNRRWAFDLDLQLEVAGEDNAEFTDSLSVAGSAAATYRYDEDLGLTAGLWARSELEDDGELLPVLGVQWRIDERTRLSTRGLSLDLEHRLTDRHALFSNLAYRHRQYRLDELGPIAEGALADRELRLVGGYSWQAGLEEWRAIVDSRARVYAGVLLYRELEFRQGDATAAEIDLDPTAVLGASVSLRF
jgi:hypothetical protein